METTYRLQRGDTLYQIAHYYNTTVAELLALNPTLNPHNLRVGEVIVIRKEGAPPTSPTPPQDIDACNARCRVVCAMRKAWAQHIYWGKILLTSVFDRLRDVPEVASRLMQNPVDIVAVFSRYFPREAMQQLTRLLTEHVEACSALFLAMRDGADTTELSHATDVNSDKIAALLAAVNPKYEYARIKTMLDRHVELLHRGANERLANKYLDEIQTFNYAESNITTLADYLAENLPNTTRM